MNGHFCSTSATLALVLALGISGAAAAREPVPERAPEVHQPRAEHRHAGPGSHGRWQHHPRVNVIPYAFSTAPVYVYSYPYVSVYSAPFSPGTLHFVEPGQVTVIQPMAWE